MYVKLEKIEASHSQTPNESTEIKVHSQVCTGDILTVHVVRGVLKRKRPKKQLGRLQVFLETEGEEAEEDVVEE